MRNFGEMLFSEKIREIVDELAAFHEQNPYEEGMPREALRSSLAAPVSDKLVSFCLARLVAQGQATLARDRVRLASHRIELSAADAELRQRILSRLAGAASMPPTVKEMAAEEGCPEPRLKTLLEYLAKTGEAVKVAEDLYFAPAVVEDLKERLVSYLEERGEIQAGDFKTLSRSTRKYTIPLLEYFDRTRVTLRKGDSRVLRERKT